MDGHEFVLLLFGHFATFLSQFLYQCQALLLVFLMSGFSGFKPSLDELCNIFFGDGNGGFDFLGLKICSDIHTFLIEFGDE